MPDTWNSGESTPDVGPLERTLATLVARIESTGIPYMLVGDLAVLVHGLMRFARVIDLSVDHPVDDVEAFLAALGDGFSSRVEGPAEFAAEHHALPVEGPGGAPIEVAFAAQPAEKEAIRRARPARLGGVTAQVCTPEDLVRMKLASERPQDREDAASILGLFGTKLDRSVLDQGLEDHPG